MQHCENAGLLAKIEEAAELVVELRSRCAGSIPSSDALTRAVTLLSSPAGEARAAVSRLEDFRVALVAAQRQVAEAEAALPLAGLRGASPSGLIPPDLRAALPAEVRIRLRVGNPTVADLALVASAAIRKSYGFGE